MVSQTVTRFPKGATNNVSAHPFGKYPLFDPTKFYTFFDDFDRYDSNDWLLGEVGTSNISVIGTEFGEILASTGSVANDSLSLIIPPSFFYRNNKSFFYQSTIRLLSLNNIETYIGLFIPDPSNNPSDGFYFLKSDGSNQINFVINQASTPVNYPLDFEMPALEKVDFAFAYDGQDSLSVYINNVLKTTIPRTNIPVPVGDFGIGFGIETTAASQAQVIVDKIFLSVER